MSFLFTVPRYNLYNYHLIHMCCVLSSLAMCLLKREFERLKVKDWPGSLSLLSPLHSLARTVAMSHGAICVIVAAANPISPRNCGRTYEYTYAASGHKEPCRNEDDVVRAGQCERIREREREKNRERKREKERAA